jgi:glycosyltransferase involved in cell wall biosynthesis
MHSTKKVMIGCPVRNRAWILSEYLEHLEKLDYPQSHIYYCFIINDSNDETQDILEKFAQKHPSSVRLCVNNQSPSTGWLRGSYSFRRLAELRNLLLKEFIYSDCDYLLSLDSDILIPAHALRALIEDNCDIVSCLVCNGLEIGDPSIFNVLVKDNQGRYIHIKNIQRSGIFKVDCTGAAYLIKRKVIADYGVRYSSQLGAEDIGFCADALSKGFEIYCDGRIECQHIMKPSSHS